MKIICYLNKKNSDEEDEEENKKFPVKYTYTVTVVSAFAVFYHITLSSINKFPKNLKDHMVQNYGSKDLWR